MNTIPLLHHRTIRCTAASALLLSAAGLAYAQVSDSQIPLNYNYHGLAHVGETVSVNTNSNADFISFRSIADRGLYWDPSDPHAFGTNPIIGATGITYSLFDTLGYANATSPTAGADGLDCVYMGNRVYNRGFEFFANLITPGTSTGPAPTWSPVVNITALSASGGVATATAPAHGLSVGQTVAIVGAYPIAFSGEVVITAVPDADTFQYATTATGTATGSIFSNSTSTAPITDLSAVGSTVTATTLWAHGFSAGNTIHVSGAADPNFNIEANVASVPNTTSFTYTDNLGPVSPTTPTKIVAATCIHDTVNQTTVLSSPVTLDANTEIGVLYTISNGDSTSGRGGSFDVTLTFSDNSTVVTRLHGNNWDATALPNIISNLVSSQQLIKHTVGGTTSVNFRSVSNTNDAATLNPFGTTNLGVIEGIISVPLMTSSGVNVVGKTLTKITFGNSFYNPQSITSISVAGGLATVTLGSNSGYVPGMPIRISGVLSNNAGAPREFDGDYTVDSLVGTNQVRFLSSATGTASAKMFADSYPVTSISMAAATGTVTLDAPGHMYNVGDRVTMTGLTSTTGTTYSNGVFTVASVTDAQHFTYKNIGSSGTTSAQMQITRPGDGRGYQVHAVTVRTGTASNASCLTAINIPATNANGTTVNGSNSHALSSGGDPVTSSCGTNDTTAVYYTYTAAGSDPLKITTCAPFSNTISVYTGTCGALTSVACNASNTANCGGVSANTSSSVSFNATGGQTYFIRVAGQNGAMGNFTLNVVENTNVNCSGALPIAAGDTNGTTVLSANTDTTPCGAAGNDKNAVWYQYTVTGTGMHTVEARTCLDGQTFALPSPAKPLVTGVTGVRTTDPPSSGMSVVLPLDTTLAVYSDCSGGAPIVCNDDGCSVSSRVQWTASAGQTFLIRVASKGSTTGNFVLHIDDLAHTDLPLPLAFNWNGICHGTAAMAGPDFFSEQCVTSPQSHENRSDLNGYRSISDRGLLFDPNNTTANAFNYGGTIGYQGMQYQVYGTPLQMDVVHLGIRPAIFQPNTVTWASPATTSPNTGYLPLWLPGDPVSGTPSYDHSSWSSSVSGLNATFGDDTKLGLIYHMTNLSNNVASFTVRLDFFDGFQAFATVNGTDWFGGNSSTPYNASLPSTYPPGVETHRILGIYNAVQNVDRGDAGGPTNALKVVESVLSTSSLAAAGYDPRGHGILTSITFSGITVSGSAASIFAATLRDPASYNPNYGPTGAGTVTPNQLNAGGTGKMTVTVSRGSPPNNAITAVEVDASQIGLSPNLALNDSGTGGDAHAGDNVWSTNVSFPINATPNAYSLPFTVTDSQGRTATGNIIFSVVSPTGSLVPSTGVVAGITTVHASFVFGTAGGISSIILDGTQLGLSNMLALNDSGTGGDTAANDGTWGVNFVVSPSVVPGDYTVPYTITDTASNSIGGSLMITVTPPTGACCNNSTGACTMVTAANCSSTTSTYQGDNIACPTSCPALGICCNTSTGACTVIYGGACASGTSQGSGTTCGGGTPDPSCPPTGSCCVGATGACTLAYGSACASGSVFNPGGTCAGSGTPDPNCPATACCDGAIGVCTVVFSGSCGSGTPATGNTCSPNTCAGLPSMCENFDGSGSLPAGWASSATGSGSGWNIVSDQSHSAGNSVFASDPATVGSDYLTLPAVTIGGSIIGVDFWSYYDTESTFDGWTLEISSDGGSTFTNVGDAAWTLNGYNSTISATFSSDIGGQRAFSGTFTTWTEHTAVVGGLTAGNTYILRFHMASDSSVAHVGVWLDDICVYAAVSAGACCENATGNCSITTPANCGAGSTFNGASSCSPTNPCPPPPGVCCRGSTCNSGITQASCATNGALAGAFFSTSGTACNGASTTTPCCYPDYNKLNGITVGDIFDFLNDWFAGQKFAIVGGDGTHGQLQVQNIFDFLNAWFAGGC